MARRVLWLRCTVTLRGLRVCSDERTPEEFRGRTFGWLDLTFEPTSGRVLRVSDAEGGPLLSDGRIVRLMVEDPGAAVRAQNRAIRRAWADGDGSIVRAIGRGEAYGDLLRALSFMVGLLALVAVVLIGAGRFGELALLAFLSGLALLMFSPAISLLRRFPSRFTLDRGGVRATFRDGAEFAAPWGLLRGVVKRGHTWRLTFVDGRVLRLLNLWEVGGVLGLAERDMDPIGVAARATREGRGWTTGRRLAAICITLGLAGGAAIYIVFTRAMMPRAGFTAVAFAAFWCMLPAAAVVQHRSNQWLLKRAEQGRRARAAAGRASE